MVVREVSRGSHRDRPLIRVLLLGNTHVDSLVARCLIADGGFEVHAISEIGSASIRHSKRVCFESAPLSTEAEVVEAVRRHCKNHEIDVLLPVDVSIIVLVDGVRDRLPEDLVVAPIPEVGACSLANDKWSFTAFARELGLLVPTSCLASDLTSTSKDLGPEGQPVVLKPRVAFSGHGIQMFSSRRELKDAIENGELAITDPSQWMVESFVPGTDAGSSFLAIDGDVIGVSHKRNAVNQTKSFQSAGLVTKYVHDVELDAVVKLLARSIGWNGPANLDFRTAPDGNTYLLELNPRFWSSLLGDLSRGMNFPAAACRLAVGQEAGLVAGVEKTWLNHDMALYSYQNMKLIARDPQLVRQALDRTTAAIDLRINIGHLADITKRSVRRKVANDPLLHSLARHAKSAATKAGYRGPS